MSRICCKTTTRSDPEEHLHSNGESLLSEASDVGGDLGPYEYCVQLYFWAVSLPQHPETQSDWKGFYTAPIAALINFVSHII